MTQEGSIERYPDETYLATEMQLQSFSQNRFEGVEKTMPSSRFGLIDLVVSEKRHIFANK